MRGKTDYRAFTEIDKLAYKNTVLLVGALEHQIGDGLAFEKLPEKEVAVVEESELTKNVKDK